MDKYRPERPTSLALFPQLPQAGSQVGRGAGGIHPGGSSKWVSVCVCVSCDHVMGHRFLQLEDSCVVCGIRFLEVCEAELQQPVQGRLDGLS